MRLGITGGIGAGKSYVSRLLTERFAIPVYNCDDEAKRLMTSSPQIRQQLTALLGNEAYTPSGGLNKPVIARYLFANAENARRVNEIVHPVVKSDFQAWAAREEAKEMQLPIVAMESAILQEAGLTDSLDAVLFVDAPLELRIQRAMKRDAALRRQIEERIARQASAQHFRQMADYVVTNDGRDLVESLRQIIQTIIKEQKLCLKPF